MFSYPDPLYSLAEVDSSTHLGLFFYMHRYSVLYIYIPAVPCIQVYRIYYTVHYRHKVYSIYTYQIGSHNSPHAHQR